MKKSGTVLNFFGIVKIEFGTKTRMEPVVWTWAKTAVKKMTGRG